MTNQFPGVNFVQNSYRASEYENNFDMLAQFYSELLDGNTDNVDEAINLINKYCMDRDELGFSE